MIQAVGLVHVFTVLILRQPARVAWSIVYQVLESTSRLITVQRENSQHELEIDCDGGTLKLKLEKWNDDILFSKDGEEWRYLN